MLCLTVSTAVTFVFAIAVVLHCVVVPVVAPVAVFPWSRVIGCIFEASTIVDAVVCARRSIAAFGFITRHIIVIIPFRFPCWCSHVLSRHWRWRSNR